MTHAHAVQFIRITCRHCGRVFSRIPYEQVARYATVQCSACSQRFSLAREELQAALHESLQQAAGPQIDMKAAGTNSPDAGCIAHDTSPEPGELPAEESFEIDEPEELPAEESLEIDETEDLPAEESLEIDEPEELPAEESLEIDEPEELSAEESLEIDEPGELPAEESLEIDESEELPAEESFEIDEPEELSAEESLEIDEPEELSAEESLEIDEPEELSAGEMSSFAPSGELDADIALDIETDQELDAEFALDIEADQELDADDALDIEASQECEADAALEIEGDDRVAAGHRSGSQHDNVIDSSHEAGQAFSGSTAETVPDAEPCAFPDSVAHDQPRAASFAGTRVFAASGQQCVIEPEKESKHELARRLSRLIPEGWINVPQNLDAGPADGVRLQDFIMPDMNQHEGQKQYLVFALGTAEFAAPVENITEIGMVPGLTRVPHVPDWLLGIMNLRGDIVPVVDIQNYLGMGPFCSGANDRFVLMRVSGEDVRAAVVVNRIIGIQYFVEQDILIAGQGEHSVDVCIRGVYEAGEQTVAVLDIENMLLSSAMQQFKAL
jgi:chemotaxis signal transduction protein